MLALLLTIFDRSFDRIVSSYEELAATALLTLHMEIRYQIIYYLHIALSPETAPYILEQDVNEPDPQILSLNSELVSYDETVVRFLRPKEIGFVRIGLGMLINSYLVTNAHMVAPMNAKGCGRMQLNILVLQQNLKNIEEGVDRLTTSPSSRRAPTQSWRKRKRRLRPRPVRTTAAWVMPIGSRTTS
jgi:exocyst complex component 4